jgi:translation initiation factor eIF-2B subunit beta
MAPPEIVTPTTPAGASTTTTTSPPTASQQQRSDLLNEKILVESGLAEFTLDIKLGKFARSYDVARRTVVILNQMIKDNTWTNARDLLSTLGSVCAYIDSLGLVETAISNMIRRIMRIVRDECQNYVTQMRAQQEMESSQSQLELTTGSSGSEFALDRDMDNSTTNLDLDIYTTGIHANIIEGIELELLNEIDSSSKTIAEQAINYVQTDEIILILGKSDVIEMFLKKAAKSRDKTVRRKFTVIVVELAPYFSGHEMANLLSKHDISTLIIPDSAVFAIMSRVNKVILSAHSMMANGGIKAPAGSHSVALAAKHFAVPVIVCCPMYKLTPSYLVSHDSAAFEQFSNLHAAYPEPYVSPFVNESQDTELEQATDEKRTSSKDSDRAIRRDFSSVESVHTTFDYVQPELITLFVSHIGGNSPSYVYQLLNELYCRSDYLK